LNRGIGFALASAALFGVSTPLAKHLVGAIQPLLLAGLLYLGSGVGLLLMLGVRQAVTANGWSLSMPQPGDWRWLTAAILCGGIAAPVALMYGLLTTSASTASLLLNLEGVFTALLAWVLFRENYERRVALGMVLIVFGGLVLTWTPGQSNPLSPGALLIGAACLLWALDNNLTRKVAGSDALMIASLKGLVAGTVNVFLALLVGAAIPDAGIVAGAAAVGFLGYGISLALFVLALRHLGSARSSAYFSVAPFFGAVVALAVQGDSFSWQLLAAGMLMGLGVWLHLSEQHQHPHVHERLEHSHSHTHDEHHQHSHENWDGREPHAHTHVHEPLVHTHAHFPDLHHRHPH
jgi:drug/metabolite transporter (DMT)-like permease